MRNNPLQAYDSVVDLTASGRELEANVLMRAAQMLAEVRLSWTAPQLRDRLDHALRHNQRIWTLFQSELMDDGNPLPAELRQNLLALSVFIDQRTFDLMAHPAPEKLDILIEINKNIAAGLRGDPSGAGDLPPS